MGLYEELCISNDGIEIKETNRLPHFQSGFYINGTIYIKSNLSEVKKAEVLFEELAHHKLTYGNILNQSSFNNRKFENYAVRHSYETAMPLSLIINAYKQGVGNLFELSEFVQLSEDYVSKVLDHYKSKYGQSVYHNNHLIVLDPLQVFEYKDVEDK